MFSRPRWSAGVPIDLGFGQKMSGGQRKSSTLKRSDISRALRARKEVIQEKKIDDIQKRFSETDILQFLPDTLKKPKKIRAFSTRDVRSKNFPEKWDARLKNHLLSMSNFYRSGSQFHDTKHANWLESLARALPGYIPRAIPAESVNKNGQVMCNFSSEIWTF